MKGTGNAKLDAPKSAASSKSRVVLLVIATAVLCFLPRVGANTLRGINNSTAGDALRSVRRRAEGLVDQTKVAAAAKKNGPGVISISLIGERHSGTNWITDHLQECFGDQLQIKVRYARFKHWFQFDYQQVKENSTVVVAMFRDPYDWVNAMQQRPHHAHNHIRLPWKEFVTRAWRGPRKENDENWVRKAGGVGEAIAEAGSSCISNYKWNEVIPCSESDATILEGYANYMYELNHDGSGTAYQSIVDLRRDKILNFFTVPSMKGAKSFHPYRYEELYQFGTDSMLKTLEEATGKKAKCNPYPAKGVVKHKKEELAYFNWMREHVDWEVEAMVGYNERQSTELR